MAVRKQSPRTLSKEYVSDSSNSYSGSDSEQERDNGNDRAGSASNSNTPSTPSVPVERPMAESSTSEDASQSEDEGQHEATSERTRVSKKRSKAEHTASLPRTNDPIVTSIPAKPFKAPRGFSRIIADSSSSFHGNQDIFSDLETQRIWHITAPASLPLSSVQQIDLSAIGKGSGIVTHHNREYSIGQAKRSSKEFGSILLPINGGSRFNQRALNIEEAYQIYELPRSTNTSDINIGQTSFLNESVIPRKYAKPIREQPKGLKLRYIPLGTADRSPLGVEPSNGSCDQRNGSDSMQQIISNQRTETPRKRKKYGEKHESKDDPDEMDLDTSVVPESSVRHLLTSSKQVTATPIEFSLRKSKEKKT